MRFFSLFLSVIVLSSCTYGVVKSSLDEAQQWVDDKPDTSLSILKTLNRQSLRGRSAARYSLLYAKALDKNYIDTTDISIIEPALKFYDRFGTDFEKAQTHYYEGRILQNAGLLNESSVAFDKALTLAAGLDDYYLLGLINSAQSNNYGKSHNTIRQIEYSEDALKYFLLTSNIKQINIARYNVARVNSIRGNYATADSLYTLVIETTQDDRLKGQAMLNLASQNILHNRGNAEEEVHRFETVLDNKYYIPNVSQYAAYAYALSLCGRKEKSERIFSLLKPTNKDEKTTLDYIKSKCYASDGQYDLAYALLFSANSQQDSILRNSLEQSIDRSRLEYQKTVSEVNIARNEKQTLSLLLMAILVLLLLAITVVCVEIVRRVREKNRQLDEKIHYLNEMMEMQDAQTRAKIKQFVQVNRQHFQKIGRIAEAYALSIKKRKTSATVQSNVETILQSVVNPANSQQFELLVNEYFDGIMEKYRLSFPALDEADYRFAAFIFAGFDAASIATIMSFSSKAAVYTRKYRMKVMIQSSVSKDKSLFMEACS